MNKLFNTDLGGYPFVLDDLRFESESVRSALKGSIFHLGGRKNDLSDAIFMLPVKNTAVSEFPPVPAPETATVVDASVDWTTPDMWVFMDGEFWFLPSQVLSTNVPTFSHYKVQKNIGFTGTPPGLKTFQSGDSNETYEVRTASLLYVAGGASANDPYALRGTNGAWKWNESWLYQNLLKTTVGFVALQNEVNNNASEIAANGNTNVDQQNELNEIRSSWTELTPLQLGTMMKQGEFESSGDVSEIWQWTGSNESWGFYKVIGKTVHVNLNLVGVNFQSYANASSKSLILENLGSIFGITGQLVNFFSYGQSVGKSIDDNTLSENNLHMGRTEITKRSGSVSDVVISKPKEYLNNQYTFFNRLYDYPVDHRGPTPYGPTTFVPTWTFKQSFTLHFS
jgi:hypothetical protein